ncbi:MAG: ATP-binding protein [Pseudomonadota bacterium]
MRPSFQSFKKTELSKKEFEKIREEFEDFSYIVSHDLNAPLRYIREFGKLFVNRMEKKFGPGILSEEEKQFLDLIHENVSSVETRISALLQYSRLNTEEMPYEKTDCSQIVQKIKSNILADTDYADVIFDIDELPIIKSQIKRVADLFGYIIDNAIKFRSQDVPKVSIRVKDADVNYLFSIEDNGIGIEQKFSDEVFRIFRRLHSEDKYPGVGMGLTLSKKIIELHDGEIWIEPAQTQGSIVYFTLPKAIL